MQFIYTFTRQQACTTVVGLALLGVCCTDMIDHMLRQYTVVQMQVKVVFHVQQC